MNAKRRYRRIARFYDLLDLPFERGRYKKLRPLMFAGLGGRVLDAGVGTGCNMPHYPAGGEIVGIDLSQEMLARAARRRAGLGVEIDWRRWMCVTRHLPTLTSMRWWRRFCFASSMALCNCRH